MWDGYLGRIKAAKHRIELTPPDVIPVQNMPYRAGPKARELEE